ncbi:MAG TPA: hypothetical protein PKD26_04125 [Pyrinomonadaceae bacterium]|nr:hypothetical protein [Pyrinomonadaceae bacterium]
MDVSFELKVNPTHLHLRHPPGSHIAADEIAGYWSSVGELCRKHACRKLLIESYEPEGSLGTIDVFDAGRTLAENLAGVKVALCHEDFAPDELSLFFQTVAQNRGVKVEFFPSLDEAVRWLDVDTGETAEQLH